MTETQASNDRQLLVSVDEAAKLLGISRSLAYQLCAEHELPTVRLGRRLVVPARALTRIVEEAEVAWLTRREQHPGQ
jgi:excisionase family DNA binding protein